MIALNRPMSLRLLAVSAGLCWTLFMPVAVRAQTPPCSLLPGQPEGPVAEVTSGNARICVGRYWVRTDAEKNSRQGIQMNISLYPDAAAAIKVSSRQAPPGYRPVAYGNGGFEKVEDASIPRPRGFGSITGEGPTPDYHVMFRCGAYYVSGVAEPDKGIEARRLLSELSERMKGESLCGGAATTSAPPPAATTQSKLATTTSPQTADPRRVFSVGGDCVRQGQGLLCTAAASNPPDPYQLAQIRFLWAVDGAVQGSRSATLTLPVLAPGPHVVGVKAFTPDTTPTETVTIQVR